MDFNNLTKDTMTNKINTDIEEIYNYAKHYEDEEQVDLEQINKINALLDGENRNDSNEIKDEETLSDSGVKDNDTLLISEIKNKVLLPYKVSDLEEKLQKRGNKYKSLQEIIDKEYIMPLFIYKHSYISRYREAFNLMRKKEKASFMDSLDLAFELMGNRYLHPAIITACKNSDELDIYLDCLATNELDDFPFFKIEYELYPIALKRKEFEFENTKAKKAMGLFKQGKRAAKHLM